MPLSGHMAEEPSGRSGNSAAPAPTDTALLARVWHRVLAAIQSSPLARRHLTVRSSEGHWKQIAPGVTCKVLHASDGVVSALWRLEAATSIPAHSHASDEECLVLEGTVRIGDDLLLRPGDFHLARQGIAHPDVTTETGALLYVRGADGTGDLT